MNEIWGVTSLLDVTVPRSATLQNRHRGQDRMYWLTQLASLNNVVQNRRHSQQLLRIGNLRYRSGLGGVCGRFAIQGIG